MTNTSLKSEFATLVNRHRLSVERFGFAIDLQIAPEADEIFLLTSVFDGGDYIPKSVRLCLGTTDAQHHTASLVIDEEHFRVLLVYRTPFDPKSATLFEETIAEFLDLAEEWRSLLEEHGQQDLVYVPVK